MVTMPKQFCEKFLIWGLFAGRYKEVSGRDWEPLKERRGKKGVGGEN